MGHSDYFDQQHKHIPESQQTAGEGERDYFEHVSSYKVSSADNMLVIAALTLLICLGVGVRSNAPVPAGEMQTASAALLNHLPSASEWCEAHPAYSADGC